MKDYFKLFLINICFCNLTNCVFNLEFPTQDLKEILPLNIQGWMDESNERGLENLINRLNPKKIIEIGTWLGKSAIFMAKKVSKNSKVFCIDRWVPHKDISYIEACKPYLKICYEQFLSNCIHSQVTDIIVPMKMVSMDALKYFESDIDVIYIDGSVAEEDVYNDVTKWWEKLSVGGIICGDNWNKFFSVVLGIKKAAKDLNIKIHSDRNFWWSDPKK